MTAVVVIRQRLQLSFLFLIVALLCHFGVRDLRGKTPPTGEAARAESTAAEKSAEAHGAVGDEAAAGRKRADRTRTEEAPAGISATKLRDLRQKYSQQLDLWYDDAHANPMILELAGISPERLPELQEVVTQVKEEATRRLKPLVARDDEKSRPEEGIIAFSCANLLFLNKQSSIHYPYRSARSYIQHPKSPRIILQASAQERDHHASQARIMQHRFPEP